MSKSLILSILLVVEPIQAQWQRMAPRRAPGYQQRVWTDVTSTVAMMTAPVVIWELMQRNRDKPGKTQIMRSCLEFQDKNGLRIFRCEDAKGNILYLEMQ